MCLKRFQNLEVSFSITILIKYFQVEQLPNEAEELKRHRIERAEEELGLLQIFENMAIGREDQNEDEDLDVVVVEDQNVQDQNQAMEQDLDRPKLKKIKFRQVSCLFSKKNKFLPSNSNQSQVTRKGKQLAYFSASSFVTSFQ